MINNSPQERLQEEIDELRSKLDERCIDKALQMSSSLWSALITSNSVIVASLSILTPVVRHLDKSLNNLLILALVCCLFSIALLVSNFAISQKFYFELGKARNEDDDVTLSKKLNKLKTLSQRTYIHRKFVDIVTKVLFFCELILLSGVLYFML